MIVKSCEEATKMYLVIIKMEVSILGFLKTFAVEKIDLVCEHRSEGSEWPIRKQL